MGITVGGGEVGQKKKKGVHLRAHSLTSLSKEHSRCSLLGDIMNSLLTSTDGCSPGLLGAYITFRMARRTEFLRGRREEKMRHPSGQLVGEGGGVKTLKTTLKCVWGGGEEEEEEEEEEGGRLLVMQAVTTLTCTSYCNMAFSFFCMAPSL